MKFFFITNKFVIVFFLFIANIHAKECDDIWLIKNLEIREINNDPSLAKQNAEQKVSKIAFEKLIKSRKNGDANKSYTARLFNQGLEECCKKFGEESVELIIAALNKKDDNLKEEAADLIYHLLVLLEFCDIDFEDILSVLKGRSNQSGLQEKSNRL